MSDPRKSRRLRGYVLASTWLLMILGGALARQVAMFCSGSALLCMGGALVAKSRDGD